MTQTERLLFDIFESTGRMLYLVGGTVRDRLMGNPSSDLDFATDALPSETASLLAGAGFRPFDIGGRFGTISAVTEEGGRSVHVEVTTFRTEKYRDGSRKPSVEFGTGLEEDLRRRDFTINAIAQDSRGVVTDPCGGVGDLEGGLLRTPGDPLVTMREDPLRILRAVRFSARFGFALDPALERSIRENGRWLEGVAVERWVQELDGILHLDDGEASARGMAMIADLDLIGVVLPELAPLCLSDDMDQGAWHEEGAWSHSLCVLSRVRPVRSLRWAALLHDAGKPSCRTEDGDGRIRYHGHPAAGAALCDSVSDRLKFSRTRRMEIRRLVGLHPRPADYRPEWTHAAVARLARDAGDLLDDLLELSRADASCRNPSAAAVRNALLDELTARLSDESLRPVVRLLPEGLGAALAAHLTGRAVGEALAFLEDLAVAGEMDVAAPPSAFVDALRQRRPDLFPDGHRHPEDDA